MRMEADNCTGNTQMSRSGWNHHVTCILWRWQLSRQVWTARDVAPDMLSDRRFFAPCYIKSEWAFLHHLKVKSDSGGKHRAALTSQIIWISEKPHFPTSFSRLPPFCHPQPRFLRHFVRFLGSATSFSLSLGCSSVVAYTWFSVMFSLLSSTLLVYQIAQAHIKQDNEASRG